MNELTAALKEELNVDTAFTLPIFGGIDIPESIAVSWGIMAFLVIVSILLTRNLKVNHISKRQAILETAVVTMDKLTVARARKIQKFLSQPFFVAENFTGLPGKYVPLAETVKGFAAIVDGQVDDLPEWAFFNVGTLDDARKKAAEKGGVA